MIPDTWSLLIDEKTEAPVVMVRGEFTLDNFRQFLSAIGNIPAYQDSDKYLWDLRHATEFPSTNAIRSLARLVKSATTSPYRVAIIVSQEVHFGLARMFAILSEQPGVGKCVFRDYERACAWLAETEQPVAHYLAQSMGAAL